MLIMGNSTKVHGTFETHLFPTFCDTANHVIIDKAGLDVKVFDFSVKEVEFSNISYTN